MANAFIIGGPGSFVGQDLIGEAGPAGPPAAAIQSLKSAAPELVDLSIEGWHRGTSLLAQGLVPLLIFAGGQFNPQPAQAHVFPSARTPPVVESAVRTVSAEQQQYVDSYASIWRSVLVGTTPQPIPLVTGQPQDDPSQLAARIFPAAAAAVLNPVAPFLAVPPQSGDRPTRTIWQAQFAGNTPRVSPTIFAQPQPDTTQASSVFQSARTPPAAASGDLAAFIQGAPEQVDLSIEGWHRGTSLQSTAGIAGFVRTTPQYDLTPGSQTFQSVRTPPAVATGPVPTFLAVAPQYDLYRASTIWRSTWAQGPGQSSEFRFGLHAVAIYSAESVKSTIWKPSTPPVVSYARSPLYASPQRIDLTQQGSIFKPIPGKQGGVPDLVLAPQQPDTTVRGRVFEASRAPVASTLLPVTFLGASPQLVDLTQQGLIFEPTPGKHGAVPSMQWASQDDPSQIAASVFIAPPAPPLQFGGVPATIFAGQPQEPASHRHIDARLFSPLEFGVPPPPSVWVMVNAIDFDTGRIMKLWIDISQL